MDYQGPEKTEIPWPGLRRLKEKDMRENINKKNTSNFKILLAEDNELNQRLTKLLLEEMQFDCDVAENGKSVGIFSRENDSNIISCQKIFIDKYINSKRKTAYYNKRNK